MSESRTRVEVTSLIAGLTKLGAIKESVARTMGFAMGSEVYGEAQLRVPVGTAAGGSITPGLLRSALYVAYDERHPILVPDVYRYTVSWNSKKAPHGHLIEFGHWMPYEYQRTKDGEYFTPTDPLRANPTNNPGEGGFWVRQYAFLGPAFDAKLPRLAGIAFSAGMRRFGELMQ